LLLSLIFKAEASFERCLD